MIPSDLFYNYGNREAVEQVKNLRLAKITSVNLDDMVVDIEFLEESSGKTRVPIPMPSAYPGGGIYSVPKKGALVIVGLRAMQTPVIIAYYPFNAFSPDSFYAISKQVFGIPDDLSEGDIFMRAASDSAKCVVCGVTSLAAEFEANIDPTTLVERCPNCKAPAFVNDDSGRIVALNKKQLGTTFHMRADGQIFIQGDNLASADNGDTQRLLKIAIDSVSGDITIDDAGDFRVSANGDAALDCNSLTITSGGKIEEGAASRLQRISGNSVESALNRTIQAVDTLTMAANIIAIRALSSISEESAGRSVVIGETDTYVTGDLVATIQASRLTTVGTSDTENVLGAKVVTVGTTLAVTVTGGSTLTIGGAEVVNVTGASTTTVGGAYVLNATGAVSITSAATVSLVGTTVVFNGGVLPVARRTDKTLVNSTTDSTFITFLSALTTFLTSFQTFFNVHTHSATGLFTGPPIVPFPTAAPTAPTVVTGAVGVVGAGGTGNPTVLA